MRKNWVPIFNKEDKTCKFCLENEKDCFRCTNLEVLKIIDYVKTGSKILSCNNCPYRKEKEKKK